MFGIEFLPQEINEDTERLIAMLEGGRENLGQEVDFVLIPTNPRNKASVSSLLGAYVLRERFSTMNVESRLKYMPQFVPTISGAGLDKMQIISRILGAKYGEFKSVALIGGESGGLDGASLIALASEILGEVSLISGSVVEIWEKDAEQKLVKKLQAGVDRIITQPIFSIESAKKCVEHFCLLQERCGTNAKLLLGVFGIFSVESAYRINEARLGFKIPHTYLNALEQGKAKERFKSLWEQMQEMAKAYNVSLYLSTPKHNDLRAYRMG